MEELGDKFQRAVAEFSALMTETCFTYSSLMPRFLLFAHFSKPPVANPAVIHQVAGAPVVAAAADANLGAQAAAAALGAAAAPDVAAGDAPPEANIAVEAAPEAQAPAEIREPAVHQDAAANAIDEQGANRAPAAAVAAANQPVGDRNDDDEERDDGGWRRPIHGGIRAQPVMRLAGAAQATANAANPAVAPIITSRRRSTFEVGNALEKAVKAVDMEKAVDAARLGDLKWLGDMNLIPPRDRLTATQLPPDEPWWPAHNIAHLEAMLAAKSL
jgi:hypothetical protein